MPVRPEFGEEGGQRYPVLRSIQTFLQQMAEGGARAAPTVIKELLQNADDAGATEVVVLLDDREHPAAFSQAYADMVAPALLVRNNASFRLPADVGGDDQDDFSAIRDVAGGHKRAQATAAGRFGIGFNSVYFLTDTP
jgi:sacsin